MQRVTCRRNENDEKKKAMRWPLMPQGSFNEHLDGRSAASFVGGSRKPCVVTWVTRTRDADGRVSPMLPPFLAVVAR